MRIENVTARYGVLTLAGPGSRELLQRVSRDDFSNAGFPFFRARHVEVGTCAHARGAGLVRG